MKNNQYHRQSFLGKNAQDIFSTTVVGLTGLGGGGSHVAQQLAHIGFQKFVVFDPDRIERSNLNRVVGATNTDVVKKRLKVDIAERVIKRVQPRAFVQKISTRWQDAPTVLRECDLIFAGLDGFGARDELERTARRYLIPLIDIGMDVFEFKKGKFCIAGQVILSLPDHPCMRCMQFLNEEDLGKEARKYGAAGRNPQVVWANGVLASTAVGIGVELLTNWTQSTLPSLYLTYDGNRGLVQQHPILDFLDGQCKHFPPENVGDPIFRSV